MIHLAEVKKMQKKIKALNKIIRKLEKWNHWDWYRANYESLTFSNKKILHRMWYAKYPEQPLYYGDTRFILNAMTVTRRELKKPNIKVVELGGRRGHLAYTIFRKYPKMDWANFEIIKHKMHPSLSKYKYKEHVLDDQLWLSKNISLRRYDVFLSKNVVEHFSDSEVMKLFKRIDDAQIKYLILRICVTRKGQKWRGYAGSHVLRMGYESIKEILGRSYRILNEEIYEDVMLCRAWCGFFKRKN